MKPTGGRVCQGTRSECGRDGARQANDSQDSRKSIASWSKELCKFRRIGGVYESTDTQISSYVRVSTASPNGRTWSNHRQRHRQRSFAANEPLDLTLQQCHSSRRIVGFHTMPQCVVDDSSATRLGRPRQRVIAAFRHPVLQWRSCSRLATHHRLGREQHVQGDCQDSARGSCPSRKATGGK